MKDSDIEWTDSSLNFYIGCSKLSSGCDHCYMFRLEERWGRDPTIVRKTDWKARMRELKNWEPSKIFINSMSDTFHESLTDEQVLEMFEIMMQYPKHTYLILTKRIKRAKRLFEGKKLPNNFWIGTSIESEKFAWRSDYLGKIDAAVHFISFEPLLGNIRKINLNHIEWMIVGGESGYQPRVMEQKWIDSIFELSRKNNVAFFFKQNGGNSKCACHKSWGCRLYNGQTWDEMPKTVIAA